MNTKEEQDLKNINVIINKAIVKLEYSSFTIAFFLINILRQNKP